MEIIFGLIIGLAVGVALAFFLRGEVSKHYTMMLEAKEKSCQQMIDANDKAHDEAQAALEQKYKETLMAQEKAQQAALQAQEKAHADALRAQELRFDETMAKVSAQMKVVTDDMLQQRQKEFIETNDERLGNILNPLKETIAKMDQAMTDSTKAAIDFGASMKANLQTAMKMSEAAKSSADTLANVFKRSNNVQGNWGETVLSELLHSQGLTEGIHYSTQETMRDARGNVVIGDNGDKMRPDVILHLDEKREVIIDAKVSLTAYMDYVNEEDEQMRRKLLDDHVKSINEQVRKLSQKDYSAYIAPPKQKMDYVIMFVPHSGALWAAMNYQPDLWRKAMEKNVFIADEQTLFAALRIVALTWTQIMQQQNHEKVFALANEMLDRLGQFTKKYNSIGRALEAAQKAYEEGEKKITEGGQSMVTTANKLIKLGAHESERNPVLVNNS